MGIETNTKTNFTCQTEYRQLSLIMDPVWSRPVSLEKRPRDASSQPSLEDQSMPVPCKESHRRIATLAKKPTKKEVLRAHVLALISILTRHYTNREARCLQ